MEQPTREGESPVSEKLLALEPVPKYRGTRETLRESGTTMSQG